MEQKKRIKKSRKPSSLFLRAFLLVFVGIGAMLYNLQAAVSNFEYVLSFSSLIFVVIVPILTMRVIAEERKQKTEYPLIFSQYGDVYLLTSYGSLIAFFIMGAALIALGVFVSSLTENQGFAAGIGIAAILLNYFSVSLAEYVSSTAFGTVIVIFIFAALLAWVVYRLTKNEMLSYGVGLGIMAVTVATFYIDSTIFEGLLPDVMRTLSLFDRFETIVNGVFDMTAIVYFLSVIVFFLFLSVQSLEKRRYN